MSNEEIEKFFDRQQVKDDQQVKIVFKKRNTMYGVFVKDKDYSELKSKNFWRVVTAANLDGWLHSKNMNFARIFNGAEFSSLAIKDR